MAMIMLDIASLASLQLYEKTVERLAELASYRLGGRQGEGREIGKDPTQDGDRGGLWEASPCRLESRETMDYMFQGFVIRR